ncbi:MAG TPA: hypothetical protein VG322_01800 [Candidatus Acidoferrales bacterium]|jgi:hypothetical protein|nr:hypothetical protein [Candidatus Acidoferrales bacterium]
MKRSAAKTVVCLIAIFVLASGLKAQDNKQDNKKDPGDDSKGQFNFVPGTLVLSRSVYQGTAATVTVGQVLPPGCVAQTVNVPVLPAFVAANGGSTTTPVTVACAKATADGAYPGVFANDGPDGSFGVTSPIFLDNITNTGKVLHTFDIDPSRIVTSFSSKSELSVNRSIDKKSITFMGYVGGPGFVTAPNQLDVSNSNTPGVIDPTNPVVSDYYRSVAEVDASGHVTITEGNAYSGNNGRAAIKGNSIYYMAGNDNNGGLATPTKKNGLPIDQVDGTQIGVNLINSTGAELLYPGQAPPLPPNIDMIGRFSISQVTDPGTCTPGPCMNYAADKPGKDTNFRGVTIHDNTLYVTKGSGGNGINTVYQVGDAGTLPNGNATTLAALPFTILPGFPTGLASGTDPAKGNSSPVAYPFGIWFANDNTLYVCDEGDGNLTSPAVNGNVASTYSQQFSGVQKWHFDGKTWSMLYVLNKGLNIGIPYNPPNNPSVNGYPMSATDGCRNLTGEVDEDGIASIYAVTSTVSTAGDQGADPNMLVKVSDKLNATTLPVGDGDHDSDDKLGAFTTIRQASFGEVLRGIAFAPQEGRG